MTGGKRPTGGRGVTEEKKLTLFGRLRRVRFGLVLLTSGFLVFAGLLLAVYSQRDLLRSLAEGRFRHYLETEEGLDFSMEGSRLNIFPVRIVFDGVTLNRPGRNWVLTSESLEVDVNLYSLFFRHGGMARARLVRPRFVQRSGGGDAPAASPGQAGREEGPAFDVPALLRAALPVREVEIEDGEILLLEGGERQLVIREIGLSAFLSGGRLVARLDFENGAVRHRGADWELGMVSLEAMFDGAGAEIASFSIRAPLLEGKVSGRVGYLGEGNLEGSLTGRVGEITERLGLGRPVDGSLSFRGNVSGSVESPRLEGRVALMKPFIRGERWPSVKGSVSVGEKVVSWNSFAAAFRKGQVRSSGTVDLSGPLPRYDMEVTLEEFEPGQVPGAPDYLDALKDVNATLAWSGEGLSEGSLAGAGLLESRLRVDGWAPGEISFTADAALDGHFLEVSRMTAASRGAEVKLMGVWRVGGDFLALVSGESGELADLAAHWGFDKLGGRVSIGGELRSTPAGVRFEGPLRWEDGRVFNVSGLDLEAEVAADKARLSLSKGLVNWMGARIRADGDVLIPERQVDLLTTWEGLGAGEVAAAFGLEGDMDGSISLEGRLLGDWEKPTLSGRFKGEGFRYGDVVIDRAGGNLSYAAGNLHLSDAGFGSGTSVLSFNGGFDDRRVLTGSFESREFDLKDFLPNTAADVVGVIDGYVSGSLDQPVVKGSYEANTMEYEHWSLRGTQGSFGFEKGVFTLDGRLADPQNNYHLHLEPTGEWPFEVSLALGNFSPELAREGFLGLPQTMRDALEGFSFLAVGEFLAEGKMRDLRSIDAGLQLETVWVYTEAQTLQNSAPIEVIWEDGVLTVSKFALLGEDYSLSLSGGGSREGGWDLGLEGEVNLSIFQTFWNELEEVDAPGTVELFLRGPWDAPEPEGRVVFRGGSVKLLSLPEAIHDLKGEGELKEDVFTLNDFSGRMGDGAFIAGGTYELDTNEVDVFVEGRLDLALFKRRIPGAREMSGPVEAVISLKGTAARPEILGEARLQGAEIFLVSMPERITGLTGAVIIEEGRMELKDLSGRMGSGTLSLAGDLDWRQGPVSVNLALQGRKIVFVMEEVAKALIDTDLFLTGDFEDLTLSGQVNFLKARYYREFKDKLKNAPAVAGLAKRKEEDGKKTRLTPDWDGMALDIRVNAADRFWISNSMAELENSLNIHVGGTVKEPDLNGEVNLLRGDVTYFNRRFELFSGRIFNISPGVNPVLEAQAEVSVGATKIYLLLEGPLRKPTLQLTSVPPYSQEDLLALLTVGYTRSSLEEQKGETLAIGAAIVLSTPVIEQVREGAQEVTGIEIFQVEPSFGKDEGTARVTVGTQLSDRLYMSASQSIGVTEEQQVKLEYQVLDYFSVLGQQLRQGIYAFDLVFSYDFH